MGGGGGFGYSWQCDANILPFWLRWVSSNYSWRSNQIFCYSDWGKCLVTIPEEVSQYSTILVEVSVYSVLDKFCQSRLVKCQVYSWRSESIFCHSRSRWVSGSCLTKWINILSFWWGQCLFYSWRSESIFQSDRVEGLVYFWMKWVKKWVSGLFLMRWVNMPSVLIELGVQSSLEGWVNILSDGGEKYLVHERVNNQHYSILVEIGQQIVNFIKRAPTLSSFCRR